MHREPCRPSQYWSPSSRLIENTKTDSVLIGTYNFANPGLLYFFAPYWAYWHRFCSKRSISGRSGTVLLLRAIMSIDTDSAQNGAMHGHPSTVLFLSSLNEHTDQDSVLNEQNNTTQLSYLKREILRARKSPLLISSHRSEQTGTNTVQLGQCTYAVPILSSSFQPQRAYRHGFCLNRHSWCRS